jgi:hypothetical protein
MLFFLISISVVIVSTVFIFSNVQSSENVIKTDTPQSPIVIPSSVDKKIPEIMETNGQKHLIPLDKIRDGGPPKDGIPSIDKPKFVSSEQADFISESDIVIGLKINGESKAYPLFILVWHEIVNDRVGNVPVSVTYCPLCYTSQVFERTIDGKAVEFGTSGKLYNSNLLMYDRLTDSYWSQGLGMAVTGPMTGTSLDIVPFDLMTWEDWKKHHQDTMVLTTDTGHIRSYGTDPYGNYYTDSRIMFPVENSDDRMKPKEVIVGLNHDNVFKAYRQDYVESREAMNDYVGNKPVLLISEYDHNTRVFDRTVNGEILELFSEDGMLVDAQTNSMWTYDGMAISGPLAGSMLQRMPIHVGFWFEWVAFHPGTLTYDE